MRPDKDFRPDIIVKPEQLFKQPWIADRVLMILEDRDKMVKEWRDRGFTCLQCRPGNF